MKKIVIAAILLGGLVPVSGWAAKTRSGQPPIDCGNRLVNYVQCGGSFCSVVVATCAGPVRRVQARSWSAPVSEEHIPRGCYVERNRVTVPPRPIGKYDGFISGFACSGKNCDNTRLRCVRLRDQMPSKSIRDCGWTRWFSEERPSHVTFNRRGRFDRAATAMQCKGSYCDQRRFFVCKIVPRR